MLRGAKRGGRSRTCPGRARSNRLSPRAGCRSRSSTTARPTTTPQLFHAWAETRPHVRVSVRRRDAEQGRGAEQRPRGGGAVRARRRLRRRPGAGGRLVHAARSSFRRSRRRCRCRVPPSRQCRRERRRPLHRGRDLGAPARHVGGEGSAGLDPPMLGGGSMYRREALSAIGGFPEEVFSEDLGSSLLLTRAGWRTRFVPQARVDNRVAGGWRDYWNQHQRWTRSFYQAAEPLPAQVELPARRRIEQALQHAGYLDRVALAGSARAGRGRDACEPRSRAPTRAWSRPRSCSRSSKPAQAAGCRGSCSRPPSSSPSTRLGALVATASHVARRPLDWRSPRGG